MCVTSQLLLVFGKVAFTCKNYSWAAEATSLEGAWELGHGSHPIVSARNDTSVKEEGTKALLSSLKVRQTLRFNLYSRFVCGSFPLSISHPLLLSVSLRALLEEACQGTPN